MLTVLKTLISGRPDGSMIQVTQDPCRVSPVEMIHRPYDRRNLLIFEIRHSTESPFPGYGIVP
jgi:hypothetical protein